MINALMNGSIPSENSVALWSEPPDIEVRMLRKSSWKMACISVALNPGTGT